MGWGNFDAARPEGRIDELIANNWNRLVAQWQKRTTPNQCLVAFIVGMHGHGLVAQHGFGSGGGDHDELMSMGMSLVIEQRILHMPEMAMLFRHDHLFIRQGSAGGWIPVDHSRAAINQAALIQLDKHPQHTVGVRLVHRESFAAPVTGTTQLLELLNDDPAMLFFPFPDFVEELIASEIIPMLDHLFFAQRLLDDSLGGDTGMVSAG